MAKVTIYQGYDNPVILENNKQISIFNRSYNHNFKWIKFDSMDDDMLILLNKGYIEINVFSEYRAKPDDCYVTELNIINYIIDTGVTGAMMFSYDENSRKVIKVSHKTLNKLIGLDIESALKMIRSFPSLFNWVMTEDEYFRKRNKAQSEANLRLYRGFKVKAEDQLHKIMNLYRGIKTPDHVQEKIDELIKRIFEINKFIEINTID